MSITSRSIVDPLFWPLTRIGPDIAILLLAYVILYGGLIVAGHGVPYVMDNNETFSSLNHAYNLWHFDFFKSMGLADEAVSPFPDAHPVTHTHQGNFPRLFSFLLYALGARTPESQIWITTLTIGSASTVMAYVFFRRIGGRLFAAIAIAFLLTNYLMFAQWQVNTYRVWHGFLLFAALLCVHGINEWPVWRWMLGTILTFAALFYGELVFAAFVAISTALYAAWVHRASYRHILATWFVQGLGAALALCILVTQLVLHLGWQDFLTDMKLTFFARNLVTDKASLLELLSSFYGNRNIAFFYNLNPDADTAKWHRAISLLFEFQLAYFTPAIATVCSFSLLAAYLSPLKYPPPRSGFTDTLPTLASASMLVPGLFLMFLVSCLGSRAIPNAAFSGIESSRRDMLVLIGSAAALSMIVAFTVQWLSVRVSISGLPPSLRRSAIAGLYLLTCAGLIGLQSAFYDQSTAHVWRDTLSVLPDLLAALSVVIAALFGCLLILCGRLSLLGKWAGVPSQIAPFLGCGLVGYFITLYLSGGYVVSGYLVRLCPFVTFHISAAIALGLFVLIAAALTCFGRLSHNFASSTYRAVGIVSGALAAVTTGAWFVTQAHAYRLLPPDQLAFVKMLRAASAPNDGIVSNTYAIPFGLYGGTWAYAYPGFWASLIRSGSAPDATSIPNLWLADRQSNSAYSKPAIYVCFTSASNVKEIRMIELDTPLNRRGCPSDISQFGALQPAMKQFANPLAYDRKNGQWAIFRLERPYHE